MATLADIAKKAGVTPAVVSRIINDDKSLRVGKETRARVEKIVREMDYSPNIAAQSLRSAKSGTLAIIVHDIANPVYGNILRGAQEEATMRGMAILLGDASVGAASNNRLVQLIGGGGVDGVILQSAGADCDEIIARAARQAMPVVLLQHDIGIDGHLITLPDQAAAAMATTHLTGLGHTAIGCLATQKGLSLTTARLKGWRGAQKGGTDDGPVVYAGSNSPEGEKAALDLLARRPDITGLVCFNVMAAIGALRAARALGRRVPDDLSIIAIHDAPFAGDLAVPLTAVDMPLAEMGRIAVQAALDAPGNARTHRKVTAPPRLVLRASTAPRP